MRRVLLTAGGVVLFAGASAANSRAGTYTVYSCRTPLGAAASGWLQEARVSSLSSFGNSCPGGPLTIDMSRSSAHPANDYARLNFWAAPDTTISSYFIWRSVQLHAGYDYVRYEYVNGAWVIVGYQSGGSLGSTTDPFSQDNLVSDTITDDTGPVTGLSILVSCAEPDSSSTPCPASTPTADLQIYRADVTLNDPYPPVLTGVGGSLLSGQPLTGVQTASVSATDRGGGVYQASLVVDGQQVSSSVLDSNGGLCHEPFVVQQPCKSSVTGALALDTTQLADGVHSLKLTVTDATGTNSVSYGPVEIRTANGACNPAPPSAAARLSGLLVPGGHQKSATALTASYGKPPMIAGSLTGLNGAPIAGGTVCVATQDLNVGAALQPLRLVTTDGGGRFGFQLPAGPSRRVLLIDRAPDGAVVTTLTVRVPASLTLSGSRRSLHNRQVLKLRGRLAHGPVPPAGVLVELQALRAHHRWQTFGTTVTRPDGHFSYRYRFTRTTGVQHYRLRARVAAQGDYPYGAGASRPVRVRVKG